jgi:hypothetical protein
MILLSALDNAESMEVEDNLLCISFPAEKAMFKSQVESRDNRKLLEEICRQALGRAVSLSVSVGGKARPAQVVIDKPVQAPNPEPKAESHPMVRAIVDKFHADKVEVIDPDR